MNLRTKSMMKIDPSKVGLIPPHVGKGFCVYGPISDEIRQWCADNGIEIQPSDKYTNLIPPAGITVQDLFACPEPYTYLDGFSPNLNKHLHLGHLSNLVLAKAYQSMGVAKKTVAIFGDTLTGTVPQQEALESFHQYCRKYGYHIDSYAFASQMSLPEDTDLLSDGEGEYEGTKVFSVGDQKIVGVKSGRYTTDVIKDSEGKIVGIVGRSKPLSGFHENTTYFFQDVAFASHLNAPTLYLTGSEQVPHFALLKNMFPHIGHIGLGLVLFNGKKLSSRNEDGTEKTEDEKREIYAKEVMETLDGIFKDPLLSFNVLAGEILKSSPTSTKDIRVKDIADPNKSIGLYLSYTTARMKSAGVNPEPSEKFKDMSLGYAYVKSMNTLEPHHLFNALFKHCMNINALYKTHRIEGNEENHRMFSEKMADLELGLRTLGLFSIDKIARDTDG